MSDTATIRALPLPTPRHERPLRLVHISASSGRDATNGVGRAVFYIAEAQRALGHEVRIVSEQADHLGDDHVSDTAYSPFMLARAQWARRTRQISPRLVQELVALQPDIVHLHSIHVPEHVSLARHLRVASVPYCVTVHGGLCRPARVRGRVKKTMLWWAGEREYLNGARFVHALTNAEAEDIRSYGVTASTVVVPNGIDADSLPRPTNPRLLFALAPELVDQRVFLFMGRLAWIQKGLDLLLSGFSQAQVPDARLVLLGPDFRGGRAHLEHLAEKFGVRSRVLFLDAETPQRCADLIAGADVFVHTSRWEGMALAVLEAAVWEKPCLLTKAADPNGVIGEAGAVVVDPTPDSIADGVRALSALDHKQLLAMGRRARSIVKSRFTWGLTASSLVDAYGDQAGSDYR